MLKGQEDRVYNDLEALIDHCTRKKRLVVLLTKPCELVVSQGMHVGGSLGGDDTGDDDDDDDDDEGDDDEDFGMILQRELKTAVAQQPSLRYGCAQRAGV